MAESQKGQRAQELMCKLKSVLEEIVNDASELSSHRPPSPAYRKCCISMATPPAISKSMKPQAPPDVMVCFKTKKTTQKQENNEKQENGAKAKTETVSTCKSRELLGGILYVGCDCEKLNGLQDDCRRTQCRGSPACLAKPGPTCCPSQFSNGKHLTRKMFKKGGKSSNVGADQSNNADNQQYECYPAVVECSPCCQH